MKAGDLAIWHRGSPYGDSPVRILKMFPTCARVQPVDPENPAKDHPHWWPTLVTLGKLSPHPATKEPGR